MVGRRSETVTVSDPWWRSCRWTLGLTVVLVGLNLGLFAGVPAAFESLIAALQFDRQAILDGQWWRLLTGNLVHWSREHFLLDVAAFLFVGILYEPKRPRVYPWLLLAAGLAVGAGVLIFRPDMALYRGLSGVDSGQFALALAIEASFAWREPRRWLWIAPAAAIFGAKILYECTTGQMFFGTESLGHIGQPVPLAHAAGVLPVALWIALAQGFGRSKGRTSLSAPSPFMPSDPRTKGWQHTVNRLACQSEFTQDAFWSTPSILFHFLASRRGASLRP